MSDEKTPPDLNNLETRITELEVKMRTHESKISDIEAAFYGTNRDPEHQERLRRVGILEKLDRLDDIVRLLEERLPNFNDKAAG